MIATARLETVSDPADLAVRLAKTRVALAALKRKHATDELDDEDIAHAATLRAYYEQRLAADEAITLDEDVVPRADVRNMLQTVLLQYGGRPSRLSDENILKRLIAYLDSVISRSLTAADASDLIDLLNQTTRLKQSPTYDPDLLTAENS